MEKVQCDEPSIMKLGCLASLGSFRNTYLQKNMVLFRGMCELVSCSYLRSDKSHECFLQKKMQANILCVFFAQLLFCCAETHFSLLIMSKHPETHGRLDVSFEGKS